MDVQRVLSRQGPASSRASVALALGTPSKGDLKKLTEELREALQRPGLDCAVVSRWRSGHRRPETEPRVALAKRRRKPRIPLEWWSLPPELQQ